jgi:predicted  nucleic acid-binding Zn-ribbon protein
MLIKCICTNCAGHLEFEEENAGEKIDCPHCGFDTTLFVPGSEEHEEVMAAALQRRKRRQLMWWGGLVLMLAGLGYALRQWALPLVRGFLPEDSVVLPYVVLVLLCFAVPLLLAWGLLPIVLFVQLRNLIGVVSEIEANTRRPEPEAEETEAADELEESSESSEAASEPDTEKSEAAAK